MKKIEKQRLVSINGGVSCFLIGVSLGIAIVMGNPLAIAMNGINAYNFKCL